MSNTKTTKRALLSSVIAMFICVAMLIGTTFAWFTDSASTAVNKIQAGTLDVELEMKDEDGNWVNAEGKTLAWQKAQGAENEDVLWEPGCTYELPALKITNKGNLALQFKVLINSISGDKKLLDAIDFTVEYFSEGPDSERLSVDINENTSIPVELPNPMTSDPYYEDYIRELGWTGIPLGTAEYVANNFGTDYMCVKLSAHMKEDAGNEYQGMTLNDFAITVVATQVAGYEYDSFNNTYDKNAEYPEVVADETSLKQALAAGKDVRLGSDIALTSAVTFSGDVEVVGDGNSIISSKEVYVAPTANVNFKNVNFANPVWDNNKASSVYASKLEGKVVFDGCTFTNPQWECIQITPMDGAEVIVTNCTFVVDGNGTYAQVGGTKVERMLHIQNTAASGKYTAVITNNKFIGVDLCRNAVIDVDDIEAFANVTCGGNTFYNHDNTPVSTMDDGMIYVNINGMYDAANVATDTYAQFTQTPAAALHH